MSGRVWQCLPLSWIRRRMTLPRCRAGNVKHGCQEQRSLYEIYDVKNPCWQLFLGYLHDTCQCWGFSVPSSLFAVSVLQFLLKVWAESFLACLEGRPNKASGILSGVLLEFSGFLAQSNLLDLRREVRNCHWRNESSTKTRGGLLVGSIQDLTYSQGINRDRLIY